MKYILTVVFLIFRSLPGGPAGAGFEAVSAGAGRRAGGVNGVRFRRLYNVLMEPSKGKEIFGETNRLKDWITLSF